jgi:predicted nuclease with TOPRIM domain
MDKETFLTKVQELGQLETPEEMRAGLAELQEGVTEIFDANANLTSQHEADTKEMEAIRQANMKLFTQLGTETTPAKQAEEQTGLKQETVERRKFENLFDNKGNFIKH